MKRFILFTGTSGLNTAVDPVRHEYSTEAGVRELAVAKNLDYDETGRPSSRKGWEVTSVTGSCHSLFCAGGACLFVTGDALTLLSPSLTTTPLRNVTVGARMRYTQVGNKVYYTNGRERGFVRDNVSVAWNASGTVYHVKDSTIALSGPPTGSLLEYHNGRMYVVQHNVAWESEQYDVNSFHLAKNAVQMESLITMFKGVTSGIWVGTRNRIVFLRGSYTGDFRYEVKGLVGAIPGTAVLVDSFMIGKGDIYEVGVLFMTKYGPFLGTADGNLAPLTERKLSVPNAISGSGIVMNKKYVVTLDKSLTVTTKLNTVAVSQYTNYDFNSFCEFNGDYYGAGSGGIFKLETADRDIVSSISTTAIDSTMQIGPTDFGILTDKRLRKCVMSLEANGPVKVTVQANESSDGAVEVHQIPGDNTIKEHAIQLVFTRDLRGRYFTFIVENINGSYFAVNNIEVFAEILLRKP